MARNYHALYLELAARQAPRQPRRHAA